MAQIAMNTLNNQAEALRKHIADGTRNYGYRKNTAAFFRTVAKELGGDMPEAVDYVDNVLSSVILKPETLKKGEAQWMKGKDMFDLDYETTVKVPLPNGFGIVPMAGIILAFGRDESGWAQIDISKY